MAARQNPGWPSWWAPGLRIRSDWPRWAQAGSSGGAGMARVLGGYAAMGAAAVVTALALGHDPLSCEGWLHATGTASVLLSSGLGLCLGAVTVAATPTIVRRASWARALHSALRPGVHGASGGALFGLAVASATAEELLFRGLLVPLVGIVASSVVFGVLHQIRGRGRWGWVAWATVMGLLFATIFAATGSLAGPLLAHAAINCVNLQFLRDHEPEGRARRPLGGLLDR
ncbi:MAG TPA: CPBP family intramembrane glutamic endopeptidase [Polyangiaceae bacterium]